MAFILYFIGYGFITIGAFSVILTELFKVKLLRFGIFHLAIGVAIAIPAIVMMGGY